MASYTKLTNIDEQLLNDLTVVVPTGMAGAVALQHLSQILHLAYFKPHNAEYFDKKQLNDAGIDEMPIIILDTLLSGIVPNTLIEYALENTLNNEGLKFSTYDLNSLSSTFPFIVATAFYTKIALMPDIYSLLDAENIKRLVTNMNVLEGSIADVAQRLKTPVTGDVLTPPSFG